MSSWLGTLRLLVPTPYIPAGYAPVLLAQSLGYAAAEGLDLQVVPAGSPQLSVKGAVAGEGVGFVNAVFNFLVRDQGQPFRSFYSIARKQNRSFAVPVDSPIETLAELKGKVIGLHYPDLLDFAYAALAAEGVSRDEISFIPLPGTPLDEVRMVGSVRAREVDALWQIDHNYGVFVAEGLPLRRLPAPAIDRLTPAACFYARDDLLQAHPDRYAALGLAVAKATLFAMTNPVAVIRLLWRDVPEARPKPGDSERILRRDVAVLNDRLALSNIEDAADPRWGAITLEEIQRWQEFMLSTGAIGKRRDPTEYFTDRLVAKYNDFDPAIVRAQARRFQLDDDPLLGGALSS